MIKDHPAATLGLGLGAAALAIPATRAAALTVGGGFTGVLGKLLNLVKAPFTAVPSPSGHARPAGTVAR